MMQILRWAFAMAFLSIYPQSTRAAVQYSVTDLGTLSGGSLSEALGVNNYGQIVGYSFIDAAGHSRAFLYDGGSMIDLGVSGSGFAFAKGINNSGQIVGLDGNGHLFMDAAGAVTHLDMQVGGYGNQFGFSGFGINASGQVVGAHANSGNQAALYSAGVVADIPFGAGLGIRSGASAINDNGDIVGTAETTVGSVNTHAFVFKGGVMTDLGSLGGPYSEAEAINNSGQIVGSTGAIGSLHGFVYTPGTSIATWIDLGNHLPSAINNLGEAVGGFDSGSGLHAFVFNEGAIADLNDLIDPASGWRLINAFGINDGGMIVGTGINSDGQEHAFSAVPIPEPASVAFIALACGLLSRKRIRSAEAETTIREA